MDIWKGSVDVPCVGGATRTLENLCLSTDPNTPSPTTWVTNHLRDHISNSSFSFLSYLPPSRIPLFLAAGPSLQVATTSPATCDFFRKLFLSALPRADVEEETTEQSRIALLLQVHANPTDSLDEVNPGDWGITEILIYGAMTYTTPPSEDSATTPPHSSPDLPPVPIVSVHALPLSSRHNFAAYIQVKAEPDQEDARYIAPNPQDVLNPFISRSTKKRRADALDRVVDKKVKRHKSDDGVMGDGRNALGGRNNNAGSLPSPTEELPDLTGPLVTKKRKSLASMGEFQAQPKGFQRANSMFNLSDRKPAALVPRPRSSSSRLVEKNLIKKEPDAVERSEIESKNRDLLNKIVLEEMRRRGLKDYRKDKDQRAKSIMPAGEEVVEVAVLDEEKEQWRKWEAEREEYKGVFHHTVKAAVFALRHDGFSEVIIVAERMRRAADLLLSVFLGDRKEDAVDVVRQPVEG